MKELDLMINGACGDETINGLANSDALFAASAVQLSRIQEITVMKRKVNQRVGKILDFTEFSLVSNPLQ